MPEMCRHLLLAQTTCAMCNLQRKSIEKFPSQCVAGGTQEIGAWPPESPPTIADTKCSFVAAPATAKWKSKQVSNESKLEQETNSSAHVSCIFTL